MEMCGPLCVGHVCRGEHGCLAVLLGVHISKVVGDASASHWLASPRVERGDVAP